MDSNGFKALAFLHFYLCGVVAVYEGYHEGHTAFATIISSSVLLTTCVLTALWIHEWRGRADAEGLQGFAAGGGRAAVAVGWVSLGVSALTESYNVVYAAYVAMLVLLVYRARTMGMERTGYRDRVRVQA
ncbi:MAG: hypothetical protein ACM3SS_09035 [Rhodospirillaceae bacterium]